jgi:nucleotide-binding universal stress UspA family protein
MTGLEQILVGTDLSTGAGWALVRGAVVAGQHGARLHLMNAMPQLSLNGVAESYRPYRIEVEDQTRWADATRAQLHLLAEAASGRFGIAVQEHVTVGNAVSEIGSFVRTLPADLLLVGAHGEGFLRDLLLGSTAFALLQRAVCPLLVAKVESAERYDNVLVGIDFTNSCRPALEAALLIAPGAHVAALHAVRIPYEGIINVVSGESNTLDTWRRQAVDAARDQLDEFIDGSNAARRVERIAVYGHAAHALVSCAKAARADLIVVGKSAASSADALVGGVTKHVVEAADCDVLVVP